MSSPSLRLVHSSDWHLERPVGGLADVPEHLRSTLLDAPYQAAARVVDTAIAEEADLVVLAGDLLDVERGGPRAIAFLVEQFERLETKGIKVYWAGGLADPPGDWPNAIRLPEGVSRFSATAVEALTYLRDGVPAARLIGSSRTLAKPLSIDDFYATGPAIPSIAVLHTPLDVRAIAARGVVYWALGSRHARHSAKAASCLVHHPGTPQGRNSQETGPHGCTLVELDGDHSIHTTLVPTDVVRWECVQISIDKLADADALAATLRQRAESLRQASGPIDLLVRWNLVGGGSLAAALRHTTLASELLQQLRDEFGRSRPVLWSASLEPEPPDMRSDSHIEEDTFLGEFLREVMHLDGEQQPIDLSDYEDEVAWLGPLAVVQRVEDESARRRLLCHVAELGTDLLSGEETRL